ncbi:tyrosinase family protein [Streptomyces sp. RKAG293]|uniref:tyrosinase family protein n=1 Tax=Streptomyces sp. RKAG293 TaxID=2893403 RepID=UPI0020333303|nr:tyrosinase family protein [Streptomyces sp. RKAG293]MCM2424236.1 tyrosinase family protein [Streptomyces sp. RKAG293]
MAGPGVSRRRMLGWMAAAGAAGVAGAATFGTRLAAAVPAAEVVTRPEIRQLSDGQRTRFFNAVKTLKNNNAVNNQYNQFVAVHYNNQTAGHGVPAFLPWHREYLRLFEAALQKIDPTVVLPYWDWSRDSQAPERSVIFSSAYFGGNGAGSNRCVTSGAFAGWQVRIPNQRCLQRQFNGGSTIGSWYSPGMIENLLNTNRTSYDQFRRAIEGSPHASVHVNIGGDMSQMYSTNDPLDWVHHAFIDLLWAEWQARNPSLANTYQGSTSTLLRPFGVTVASTLDTRSLGYTYARWSGSSSPA